MLVRLIVCLLLFCLSGSAVFAKDKEIPVWLLVQKHYSTGRISAAIGTDIVRVNLPVATIICDIKNQRITLYSFKTMRYVAGPLAQMIGELATLKPLNREVFAPWRKTNKTVAIMGHKAILMERKQITAATPRPKHIVVTEYLSVCSDIKFRPDAVRFMSALSSVDCTQGLPLDLCRRSYSPKRPGLDKVPFVILSTLDLRRGTVPVKDFNLPPGFSKTSTIESMLFADYSGTGE